MADLLNIYQICPQCKGVGEINEGRLEGEEGTPVFETVVCPMCNGDKELFFGRMRKEEE